MSVPNKLPPASASAKNHIPVPKSNTTTSARYRSSRFASTRSFTPRRRKNDTPTNAAPNMSAGNTAVRKNRTMNGTKSGKGRKTGMKYRLSARNMNIQYGKAYHATAASRALTTSRHGTLAPMLRNRAILTITPPRPRSFSISLVHTTPIVNDLHECAALLSIKSKDDPYLAGSNAIISRPCARKTLYIHRDGPTKELSKCSSDKRYYKIIRKV